MRHAAKLESSERLQKLLNALSPEWQSTLSLMQETSLCAVGSAISELRANGISIENRCIGQGKYEYRLITEGAEKRAEEQGEKPIHHPAPISLMPLPVLEPFAEGRLF